MSSGPFGASEALCSRLAAAGQIQQTDKGRFLFRQGEQGRGLYLVKSGKVKLSLLEHGSVSDRFAGPGSVLGLPATMTGGSYSLTAEVIEAGLVIFIDREDVLGLLRAHPEFCFEVVEILAHEVGHMRRDTAAALTSVN